jgi:hypothetical protein
VTGPLRAALLSAALAGVPIALHAQISPGALSRAHAELEGSSHCLDCHDARQGVAPVKCLACHEALRRRVAAGKGLHARPEYRDCKTCHVEHQGIDFAIVWWGKLGRQAFDHAQTGYPLAGKHASLACAQCHKSLPEGPDGPPRGKPPSEGSDRLPGDKPASFLGAALDCAGCHKDAHQGEFAGRSCAACHGQTAWQPAPGFDHAKTRFPLTGRHATVTCLKCHAQRTPDPSVPGRNQRLFHVVAGQDCAACHEDAHRARLGRNCASCHGTSGWREVRTSGFDHDKTAYPLVGKHATLACAACHPPGRPMRVPHARCTDCHRDAHRGELARRSDGGRCESCHDVNGFRPALFGPAEHAQTAFPLRGGHLAVACNACHKRPGGAGVPEAGARAAAAPLRLAASHCSDCHADPHRGELARFVTANACESCHSVEGWRPAAFDHGRTRFRLEGAHALLACVACHRATGPGGARSYTGLAQACAGCHRDPHQGQFVAEGRAVSCDRCHTVSSFKNATFDHVHDARFRLDGAHARLACARCHKSESRDGRTFVRYKPLPITCSGCHAPRGASGGGT